MNSETATDKIGSITGSALFRRVVITLIVLNAIIVGLDTYPKIHAAYGKSLDLADRIILYLFALELVLRFFASSPLVAFFRSGWNLFDLIIVGVSFLPSSQFFTVARLFRILRALRTVSVMPDLQKLVTALLRSLPSLGHILILLALLMYVYAAIGTSLFGEITPKYFGSLHQTLLTLFSVITLEGMGRRDGRSAPAHAGGLDLLCYIHPVRHLCGPELLCRRHRQQPSICGDRRARRHSRNP